MTETEMLADLMRALLTGDAWSGLRPDHTGKVVALTVDGEVQITPEQETLPRRIWTAVPA